MELMGGCFCGDVRYRVTETPSWVGNCHCSSCRKASGAAFITYAVIPLSEYEVAKGEPQVYQSSPGVERSFCGRCGTTLTYRADQFHGDIQITVASLDHPEDLQPMCHTWVAERLPWIHLAGDEPRYPGSALDGNPIN